MRKSQSFLCFCLFFLFGFISVGQATFMTVMNNTELVNGDTSCPENLINNPGSDGISLPEAIYAANASPGPHTILFDPSLKGLTIKCTLGLPILYGDQITINGDINDDGDPDITINGAECNSDTCFWIQASDISINGFNIVGFKWAGIQITAESSEGRSRINGVKLHDNTIKDGDNGGIVVQTLRIDCLIRNVDIVNNRIVNNKSVGIGIDGGGWPGGTNNRIENITIRENTIKKNGKHAIFATASTYQYSKNNTVSGLEISDNTITGHRILSLLFSAGNDLRSKNNRLTDVLISNNCIEGTPCNIEIVGGAEKDASDNSVSNVSIVKNSFRGGGIQIGVGSFGAKNNIVDNILIGWNKIFNSKAHGITICGGGGSNNTKGNMAKIITIINNLIVNSDAIGIQLMGGYYGGPDNLIDNVNILNNTIVKNGKANPTWASGIAIFNNVFSSGNIVKKIKIANTILWENTQNDRIDGQSPDSVECSILLDSRFTGKNGNFYSSPQFISLSNLNYRLRQISPAIDSASQNVTGMGDIDLLGYPRILDGNGDGDAIVDIGAYEFAEKKRPKVEYFEINEGSSQTSDRMVTLDNKCNGAATEYMAAEDKKFTKYAKSEDYFTSPSYQLSQGYGKKKVYFKVKNEFGWSKIKKSTIMLVEPEGGQPSILCFAINTGNDITINRNVSLHCECTGNPTHYRASESLSDLIQKEWKLFTNTLKLKLSKGLGKKTIYFQVRNGIGESGVVCDQISAFYPWR